MGTGITSDQYKALLDHKVVKVSRVILATRVFQATLADRVSKVLLVE